MDPDKALGNMREAVAQLRKQLNSFGSEDDSVGYAVLDAWDALDGWLSYGDRPEDWKP